MKGDNICICMSVQCVSYVKHQENEMNINWLFLGMYKYKLQVSYYPHNLIITIYLHYYTVSCDSVWQDGFERVIILSHSFKVCFIFCIFANRNIVTIHSLITFANKCLF